MSAEAIALIDKALGGVLSSQLVARCLTLSRRGQLSPPLCTPLVCHAKRAKPTRTILRTIRTI